MSLNTETNEMRAERSDVKGGTVVKMKFPKVKGTLIDENGFVDISKLKYHPVNEKIYPVAEHEEDIKILAQKLQEHLESEGYANHTTIVICPKTGVIFSGNFRVRAARRKGITHLRAEYHLSKVYDPNANEYDEIIFLKMLNLDGKRNESNYKTALRAYGAETSAYEKKTGKEYTNAQRNEFALQLGIKSDHFKKLVRINEEAPDLIDLIISKDFSIPKAFEKVTGPKSTKIVDPNRHIFYGDLIKYPSIQKHLIERSISITRDYIAVGGNVMDDSVAGWEGQFKTTIWSNSLMSALTEGFNNTGDKELQSLSAGAEGNKTYADVLFPYLTNLANKKLKGKDKYFDTQIEIKAAEWNITAGKTKIYSNFGSGNMPEQEFIIGIHCSNFNRFLIMMVTIAGEHWTRRANDAEISLSQIFNCEPTYLLGEMFEQKNLVQVDWGKVA